MTERTPCPTNPHGDFCCWHWRGKPPTPRTIVQADCCWCGGYATFGYEAILDGSAPLSPSGPFHGTAHVDKFATPAVPTEELVERGMKIVRRLQEQYAPKPDEP